MYEAIKLFCGFFQRADDERNYDGEGPKFYRRVYRNDACHNPPEVHRNRDVSFSAGKQKEESQKQHGVGENARNGGGNACGGDALFFVLDFAFYAFVNQSLRHAHQNAGKHRDQRIYGDGIKRYGGGIDDGDDKAGDSEEPAADCADLRTVELRRDKHRQKPQRKAYGQADFLQNLRKGLKHGDEGDGYADRGHRP